MFHNWTLAPVYKMLLYLPNELSSRKLNKSCSNQYNNILKEDLDSWFGTIYQVDYNLIVNKCIAFFVNV
jgi:hypothetical protein